MVRVRVTVTVRARARARVWAWARVGLGTCLPTAPNLEPGPLGPLSPPRPDLFLDLVSILPMLPACRRGRCAWVEVALARAKARVAVAVAVAVAAAVAV